MSGKNDSSDAPGNPAEDLNSAALSGRAVRGVLWGAELATSKKSKKSMHYNSKWWSRGGSNS